MGEGFGDVGGRGGAGGMGPELEVGLPEGPSPVPSVSDEMMAAPAAATVVLERHDLQDRFEAAPRAMHFIEGIGADRPSLEIPAPPDDLEQVAKNLGEFQMRLSEMPNLTTAEANSVAEVMVQYSAKAEELTAGQQRASGDGLFGSMAAAARNVGKYSEERLKAASDKIEAHMSSIAVIAGRFSETTEHMAAENTIRFIENGFDNHVKLSAGHHDLLRKIYAADPEMSKLMDAYVTQVFRLRSMKAGDASEASQADFRKVFNAEFDKLNAMQTEMNKGVFELAADGHFEIADATRFVNHFSFSLMDSALLSNTQFSQDTLRERIGAYGGSDKGMTGRSAAAYDNYAKLKAAAPEEEALLHASVHERLGGQDEVSGREYATHDFDGSIAKRSHASWGVTSEPTAEVPAKLSLTRTIGMSLHGRVREAELPLDFGGLESVSRGDARELFTLLDAVETKMPLKKVSEAELDAILQEAYDEDLAKRDLAGFSGDAKKARIMRDVIIGHVKALHAELDAQHAHVYRL